MKKLFLLLLVLPLVVSCGKSLEDKVGKLAENYVAENWQIVTDYQSLSIKLDTLYNSVLFTEGGKENIYTVFYGGIKQCDYDIAIDQLSEGHLRDSLINSRQCLLDSVSAAKDFIHNKMLTIDVNEQIGWMVTHVLSYKIDGKTETTEVIFLTDKEANRILKHYFYTPGEFDTMLRRCGGILEMLKEEWCEDEYSMKDFRAIGM